MNFAVDTRLSVSRVNLRPASLWRSGSEAHDLRHPGQSLLAHLNFGDVGTSEDAFSAHRQVTLLDRRKARGELETADISQRIEDHLLRHPIKVVGRRRAPPLRHVDADQAAEMILKWQLALTGHVEARLERPGRSEEHTSELQSLMRIPYAV